MEGKVLDGLSTKHSGDTKYYAVQAGKKPGVYTDWPSAQEQIRGFRKPRHKKFNTRQEAEAFVNAGTKSGPLESMLNLSPDEQIRRIIVQHSAPGLTFNGIHAPKDKEGIEYSAGSGPLPPGAEDNFDPNVKLNDDGNIVRKTVEEKFQFKTISAEKNPPSMLKIYTDGSSLNNGYPGAKAGVGVFFGPENPMYVIADFSLSSHIRIMSP